MVKARRAAGEGGREGNEKTITQLQDSHKEKKRDVLPSICSTVEERHRHGWKAAFITAWLSLHIQWQRLY